MDDKIEFINATLSKLVDHFEERGEVLMVAWQYVHADNIHTQGNFISTTSMPADRALAIVDWAACVEKSINQDQSHGL